MFFYVLTVNSCSCSLRESDDVTALDQLYTHLVTTVTDTQSVRAAAAFLGVEAFDTETVQLDLSFWEKEGESNLSIAKQIGDHSDVFKESRRFMRDHRVKGQTFSTGIIFWYWPWYKNVADKTVKQDSFYQWMDFGGYSVKETYVEPKHSNLKEELLATKLVSIDVLNQAIIVKGDDLMKSNVIKSKRANSVWRSNDPYHFDIKRGDPLKPHHLHAAVTYTDNGEICKLLSESFRKMRATETIEDVKGRNSAFYWCSRYLREFTTYFGSNGLEQMSYGTSNGYETGPFFCGMSLVLSLPQFTMGLQGPTSTSKDRAVAWRFAGSGGMVIMLNNKKGFSVYEPFFDVSYISQYPEEDERLFCGSMFRLEVQTVITIGDSMNWCKYVPSLFKMDAVISSIVRDKMRITAREVAIVEAAIHSICGDEQQTSKSDLPLLDPFVLDMFYNYSLSKTKCYFDVCELGRHVQNSKFLELFLYPMHEMQDPSDLKEDVNVFRPILYNLFPNLESVTFLTSYRGFPTYALNAKSLLKVLDVPYRTASFSRVIILDGMNKWWQTSFSSDMQKAYKAKNFDVQFNNGKVCINLN